MSDKIKAYQILRQLLAIERDEGWSITHWETVANGVYQIDRNTSLDFPECVWHYLSDADIRHKEESQYTQQQCLEVMKFLQEVESDDI